MVLYKVRHSCITHIVTNVSDKSETLQEEKLPQFTATAVFSTDISM